MKGKKQVILGMGADVKSRFCLWENRTLHFSKEFGNLDLAENFSKFKSAVAKIAKHCDTLAFDMHPGYHSSRYAQSMTGKKKIPVQHHHAHIASMLWGRRIKKPVIGIAFDGTGYGSDAAIWGGEFLAVGEKGFRRLAHFQYLTMPGAERAIQEPWRMALSLLFDTLGEKMFDYDFGLFGFASKESQRILVRMIRQNINAPLTSSAGRLFDAVASLLDVCHTIRYEAQAAVALEKLAAQSNDTGWYDFEVKTKAWPYTIAYNHFVRALIKDMRRGVPTHDMARKFHNSLARLIIEVAKKIRAAYRLNDVALSGGVFSNALLRELTKKKLIDAGFNLIYNKESLVNDLGICTGQVYVALHS